MFQDIMAIDMGSSYIKVLVGNKFKIKHCGMLKTPENSVADGRIIDIDAVYAVLKEFIVENNIAVKYISFAIHGQDIIVRHTECPILKEAALRNFVQFEIGQYLPQNGENHYIDFQIIDKVSNKEKKAYKLLVAGASRDKVNGYVGLAKRLDMNLKAIDVSSNCVTRVFKDFHKKNNNVHSVGVIDIGSKSSNLIILEDGKLFIEREVAFGINNVVRETAKKFEMKPDESYEYFLSNFNFTEMNEQDEFQVRIKTLFDNVFISFDKIIQFYAAGKSKKSLDKIIIIGAGCQLYGLDEYIKKYFATEVFLVEAVKDIICTDKLFNSSDFKFYVNTFGLILKKDSIDELNISPYDLIERSIKFYRNEVHGVYALIIILIFALCISFSKIYSVKLNSKLDKLNTEITSRKSSTAENNQLKSEIDSYKAQISFVEGINKNKTFISESIRIIGQHVPKDVAFKSLTYNKGQLTINGATENYNSICEFAANLQTSKEYKKTSISSIKYDEKLEKYTFSIIIDGVGGADNEKPK